ncbi:MAG: sulfatase [bacterium]
MRETSAGAVFLASWGTPLLAGGIAGLIDGAVALAGGAHGATLPLAAASLGALLAWVGTLPLTVALALTRRPTKPSTRVATVIAAVALIPVAVLAGRFFYKRIPWSLADVALVLLGALALLALLGGLARGLARFVSPRAIRTLAALAIPGLLAAAPAAAWLARSARPPAATTRGIPAAANLLLLSVDTLRPDALGFSGDPNARTPSLDRLSRRGTTWSQCIAPSPWTLPSLASLLTATYPGQHRVLEELSGLSPDVVSLAEVASDRGRRCGAFVSNPWLATGSLTRGFDTFDVAERIESLDAVRGTRLGRVLSKVALRSLALDRADHLTTRGLAWTANGEGAWCLWLHYFDPHLPNWPAAPWDRLFGPPPTRIGSALTVEQIRAGDYPGGEAGRLEIERLYHGEVAYTDREIGRLLRGLTESGDLPNTAIAFTADHGEEFWDHGGYGHGHAMYEEVVRVPLFVVPPGGARGRVRDALVRTVDVAPTLLAAAGLPPDPAFEGVDVLAGSPDGVDATYGEATLYGPEQKFLRTPDRKVILDPEELRIEMFDLGQDPGEQRDRHVEDADAMGALLADLRVWQERVGSAGAMAARDPGDLDPETLEQLRALGYIQK